MCDQYVLPKDDAICLFDGIYGGLKGSDQRNYGDQVLFSPGYVDGTNRFPRRLVLCLLAEGLRLLAAYSEKSGANRRMHLQEPYFPTVQVFSFLPVKCTEKLTTPCVPSDDTKWNQRAAYSGTLHPVT